MVRASAPGHPVDAEGWDRRIPKAARVTIVIKIVMALPLVALLDASPAVQTPSAAPATVDGILGHMDANRAGLNSFTVPIGFAIKVHKVIGVGLHLTGIRYFQAPDKEALVMHSVPAVAKSFEKIFAGLGTPETWPSQYDISLAPLDPPGNATIYGLRGVPKQGGSVDHILLDVSQTTYEPLKARWFYKNGATIVMVIQNALAGNKYLLPKTETLDIDFPSYKAHAVASYGDYSIDTPIPDTVWQQPAASPSP